MSKYIYADNAATTQIDKEAIDVMMPFLLEEYSNPSQPYSLSRLNKKVLKQARQTIAECINAEPEEIFFTSGGTESDNWALKGTMFVCNDNSGLITSQIEHHAILNSAKAIEQMGYSVTYLPVDKDALVLPETLEKCIIDETKIVSIMLSNNEVGTIQPIKELSSIAHKHGTIFHTDAVQAVGHIQIDVKDLNVDLLSASAHKFNGPKGIGFLYIKKGTNITSLLNGGSQENGLRAGTENVASIIAMATALKNNCDNLDNNIKYVTFLEDKFVEELTKTNIDYIRNGSVNHMPGNISLSFKDKEAEMILHRLDLMGIYVSTGSACDSVNTQTSHVIKAIGVDDKYANGTIRISLGKHNTLDEVKTIVKSLVKILE